MGALIHLAAPLQADPAASRVFYFTGRSLSATDLALEGSYTDWRLLGLVPSVTGVISGLGVTPTPATGVVAGRYDSPDGTTGLASLTIGAGAGIGADGRLIRLTAPMTVAWTTLLQSINPAGSIADGIYLLLLRTAVIDGLEGPPPDPCAQGTSDKLLDIRQDSFVELLLSAPLGALPASTSAAGRALAINTLVGGFTGASLAAATQTGVPLALVLVQGNQAILLSQAAGRLPAMANGTAAMLVAQVREAFTLALAEPQAAPASAAWQTALCARFKCLPGGVELPLGLLLAASGATPSCPFLPPGMAVYLQIIRASQAAFMLGGAAGLPPVDLTANVATAVTLLLAVPDAAWTPDLLNLPRADPLLPADLHFAYAVARAGQAAVTEDWTGLYGGLSGLTAAYPQETAFLIGADAAAQNLAFLLAIGAVQPSDLVAAASASGAAASLLPIATGWIAAVNAAASVAGAAAGAAAPVASAAYLAAAAAISRATQSVTAAALAATPPGAPTAQALASAAAAALGTAFPAAGGTLAAWPAAVAAANAACSAPAATAASIAGAAAVAAASAACTPFTTGLTAAGLAAANAAIAAAAGAAVASVAAAYPGTAPAAAVTAAATAAATPPAALPPVPPAPTVPPNPADAPHLLAALGYQILDTNPSASGAAPIPSDTVLAPLVPYLPANSAFADWSAALSAVPPNPALLQTLINAGLVGAAAEPATQAAAIGALLTPAGPGAGSAGDMQAGALLDLATAQLAYAVLGRVSRAQEYLLDGHSRLIALQRQHIDMISTYVSALAGGVPSDGSGLSFTRIIPFFNLGSTAGTSAAPAAAAAAPQARAQFAVRAVSLAPQSTVQAQLPAESASLEPLKTAAPVAAMQSSVLQTIRATPVILGKPVLSSIGSLFGNQTDVAKTVASETSALAQAPPFSYQPVTYGLAAHITSGATLFQSAQNGLSGLRGLMGGPPINLAPSTSTPIPAGADEAATYDGIAGTMRALLGDINLVENNAIRVESAYMQLRDALQSLEALTSQLTAGVATARDALRGAQVQSAQAAGNYAAAQTLVQEEIARVNAAVLARSQAIAAATGLFLVRQLQTVVVQDPPGSLALTADTPADLAPGCTGDHAGPPASLLPFLDLLLEVPLANWRPLQGGWTGLPDVSGLQRLAGLRSARLVNWAPSAYVGGGAASTDLGNLVAATRGVFDPVLRASVSVGASLALSQQAAFKVFSPPDLVILPVNTLRTGAEALRGQMESATGCLFATLTGLPPSTRFAWATLARAGTLPTLDFSQWPLPAGPGPTAATLRQLAALVAWMAAQLTDDASVAAQTALGNLVSAAVIAAAYGDPDEAVTGTVTSTGFTPQPGIPIRLTLNRMPPIGTLLNVYDATRTLVATVRVQDHDSFGTTAATVSSFGSATPTAAWTVASQGGRSPWLAS